MNTSLPLDPRSLAHRLTTVGHALHHRLFTQLRESDLHPKTVMVLSVIDGRIDAPWISDRIARGGKRISALADRGWIAPTDDGWSLTDEGRAILDRVDADRQALLAQVPAEELERLTAALDAISNALGLEDDDAEVGPRGPGRGARGFGFGPGPFGPGSGRGFGPFGSRERSAFGPGARAFGFGERGFGERGFDHDERSAHDGDADHAGDRDEPGHHPHGGRTPGNAHHGFGPRHGGHTAGHGANGHGDGAHGVDGHAFGRHGERGHRRADRDAQRAYERGFDAGFTRGRESSASE